jgi:glyoxylase I family protein
MANEIIKGMGFHHMALYVSDFDKSLAFYQKLGMKVYTAWGQGDSRIALLDTGDGTMLEVFAKPGQDFAAEGRWQHLALHVENVEDALQKALAAGATLRMPVTVMDLDAQPRKITIQIAFVYGPDGEVVEFIKQLVKKI